MQSPPSVIYVRAGRHLDCGRLLRWFNEGRFELKSAFGASLILISHGLASIIPCHMIVTSGGGETCRSGDLELGAVGCPAGIVANTRNRMISRIMRLKRKQSHNSWRVPRIPLKQEGVAERIKNRYENVEIQAFEILAHKGSFS